MWGKKSNNPFEKAKEVSPLPAASPSPRPSAPPSYRSYETDDAANRKELFGGAAQHPASGAGGTRGKPFAARYYEDDEDDDGFATRQQDEETAGIKQQISSVKQDSLATTRNALNKIRETEEVAGKTLSQLSEQSSKIANIDRNLDKAKAHSDRAAEKTNELKQLNRSIFIPVFKNPFTRKSREEKELEKIRQDTKEHSDTRQAISKFEYDSQQRVANTLRKNERASANDGYKSARSDADRQRYQFEADAEDDAIEDEIDGNLDLLGDATSRLKNMALTMNTELDQQNIALAGIQKKVDPLNEKLTITSHKLTKIR